MRGEILLAVLIHLGAIMLSIFYAWWHAPKSGLLTRPRWLLLILFLVSLSLALCLQMEPVLGLIGWATGMALLITISAIIWQKRKPTPALRLQDWPLSAGIVLARLHKWPEPMTFEGGTLSPKAVKKAIRHLRQEWEIEDLEQWTETADWLLEEGQRLNFQKQIEEIRQMTDAERAVLSVKIDAEEIEGADDADQAELQARLLWIEAEGENLQQGSFMGWDMLRLIDMTRWALRAGFIDSEVAQGYLLAAGQALQQRCDSWEQAQQQYLTGLRFWSAPTYEAEHEKFERLIAHYSQDRRSPWKTIPWELELIPSPNEN